MSRAVRPLALFPMLLRMKKYKLGLINWAKLKCKNQRIRDDNRKTGHGFFLGRETVVLWRLIFVAALFVCSVCHADPSSEPWEVSVGTEKMKVFQTDYIPLATFFFAYAACSGLNALDNDASMTAS